MFAWDLNKNKPRAPDSNVFLMIILRPLTWGLSCINSHCALITLLLALPLMSYTYFKGVGCPFEVDARQQPCSHGSSSESPSAELLCDISPRLSNLTSFSLFLFERWFPVFHDLKEQINFNCVSSQGLHPSEPEEGDQCGPHSLNEAVWSTEDFPDWLACHKLVPPLLLSTEWKLDTPREFYYPLGLLAVRLSWSLILKLGVLSLAGVMTSLSKWILG